MLNVGVERNLVRVRSKFYLTFIEQSYQTYSERSYSVQTIQTFVKR